MKLKRGFASLSPERRKEVASSGGRAVHIKGTAHRWTVEEAREAGKKGFLMREQKGLEKIEIPEVPNPDPSKCGARPNIDQDIYNPMIRCDLKPNHTGPHNWRKI